ncbi:unnamed protein product [Aphanomyces euteiches]|uniref:Haemolysin-III related n=1 Tax=Aphanomyces euteiches TaxID=100861 RepID=A0A6G0W742_9STRA|nr:hypothetical protein Ae201684_018099 [Aphanomyces euteiches]KAH9067251.1 hypothetical protein Ae201684P_021413 [Aphanomyces euteiches]KAH9153333.1 hypothetical protein AeRB84_004404 [Aphanomyces euteiches]
MAVDAVPQAQLKSQRTSGNASVEKKKTLGAFDKLKTEGFAYMAENTYIHHGYRIHYSMKECLLSLFEMHNETLNVWTHMIGALIFFSLLVFVYLQMESIHVVNEAPHHVELVNLPYLQHGQHTFRLFSTHALMETSERALVQTLSLHGPPREFLESATVLFNSTLSELLQERDISADVRLLQQDLIQLTERLLALADHAWLNRHVFSHLTSLQDSVRDRLNALKMRHQETIRDGVQALTDVLNVLRFDLDHKVPAWPISIFVSSAIFCLSCSTIFHLLFAVSRPVFAVLSRLDYAGISILISGSFFPIQYYGFYCNDDLRWFYLLTTSALAAITFIMAMLPVFATHKFLVIRTCTFIAFGLFGSVPVFHMAFLHGFFDEQVQLILTPMLWEGFFYIGGAMIYMSKIPERFSPGKFDVLFGSHQIWHVCVVLAALVHYSIVIGHYEWRWNNQCPIVP